MRGTSAPHPAATRSSARRAHSELTNSRATIGPGPARAPVFFRPSGNRLSDMWERSRLRSLMVVLIALKVLGLVLLFDWSQRAVDVFDLPKSLFSRSVEWLILGLLLIALLRWGSSILPRSPLHFLVAALAVAYLVAALAAEDRYVALFGERGRYLGLTFLIDMLVLYVAVAVAFRTVRDWAILSLAVGVAVIVSSAYAWIQFTGWDPIAWQVVGSESRPFSTVGNPNTYGHFLSVALGPAAGLAVLYAARWSKPVRLVAGALTLGILVTTGIVATRGAVLGIA